VENSKEEGFTFDAKATAEATKVVASGTAEANAGYEDKSSSSSSSSSTT